jgi:hypothetical protein
MGAFITSADCPRGSRRISIDAHGAAVLPSMDMELDRISGAVASAFLCNAAQFAAGSIMAIAFFAAIRGKFSDSWRDGAAVIVPVALSAICGAVLPLGTFGVLPIVFVLASAGLAVPACAAFLCSNRFFNMLIPSTDPGFIWMTGYGRLILAVAAGAAAGALLAAAGSRSGHILRTRALKSADNRRPAVNTAAGLIGGLAWKAVIFLAVGAIVDVLFKGYFIREIVSFFFLNPVTGPPASSFAQLNVVNPLFLLGAWCIAVLTDFIGLAGLAAIVKPKGLVLYAGYCAVLAAVFCSSVLFL